MIFPAPPVKRTFSCVLWDLDGTLVDSEPLYFKAIAQLCAQHGTRLEWTEYLGWVGESDRSVWRRLKRQYALPMTYARYSDTLATRYSALLNNLQCRPGARETVDALRERGITQAVVSNATRDLVQRTLDAVGLRDCFSLVVTGDDVERPKPDPEPYVRAMTRLERLPHECLAIEDSSVGIRAAHAAGATVVNCSAQNVGKNASLAIRVTSIADILKNRFQV
jgi:HAD superfamily hydrolase (TIGR01509 family)